MKILYTCQQYWPFLCGSGAFFQEMAERFVRDGHEATVFTSDALHFDRFISRRGKRTDRLKEKHDGVAIRRFRLRHLPRHIESSWRLGRLPLHIAPYLFSTGFLPGMAFECLKAHSFDVVHGGLLPYGMFLYLAYRIARKENIPLIYSPFLHTGEPENDQVLKSYSDPNQMRLLREADAVIAQTSIEADALAGFGINQERISVVGMGVNPDDLHGGDAERFRKKHHLRGAVIFSIGPQAYDKGTQHTVQALERLRARGLDLSLVLAGSTHENFRKFYAGLPQSLRERITLIERIEGEEKSDLFAAGDIMAMPSRNESFGMAYLEAWLCGKPVVGCRAGGVPEVIEEGKDGFLVPFGDSGALADRILTLLEDPHTRKEMGSRGRDKVLRRYTWDIQYGRLKKLYANLSLPV